MTPKQPDAGVNDRLPAGQPVALSEALRDQAFREATQALAESSNRALRQFSEKLSRQDDELSNLRDQLQSVSQALAAERDQRIAAEAQLAALSQPLAQLQQLAEGQMQLLTLLDTMRRNGEGQPVAQSPSRPGPTRLLQAGLAALGGGLLAGALMTLALQPWQWAGRPGSAEQPLAGTPAARSVADSGVATAGAPQRDTLHLRCQQPCWLEVKELRSNRKLVYKTIVGSISLPLANGLQVFTGRGDMLRVRINDGSEARFSANAVAQRYFFPSAPAQAGR